MSFDAFVWVWPESDWPHSFCLPVWFNQPRPFFFFGDVTTSSFTYLIPPTDQSQNDKCSFDVKCLSHQYGWNFGEAIWGQLNCCQKQINLAGLKLDIILPETGYERIFRGRSQRRWGSHTHVKDYIRSTTPFSHFAFMQMCEWFQADQIQPDAKQTQALR